MDKLEKLISKCKASVTVTVNDHKGVYMTVEAALYEDASMPLDKSLYSKMLLEHDISDEVVTKMIELDKMIMIQFYPRTPIGCYIVRHYSLDLALDECLETMESLK